MFLYISNQQNNNYGKYLYYDSPKDQINGMQGVSMNEKYIFFWNLGSVWKIDLPTKKISKLDLYISEDET